MKTVIHKNIKKNDDDIINIIGWVRFNRSMKNVGFLDIYDGSLFDDIQIIYKNNLKNYNQVKNINIGSCLKIKVKKIYLENKKFELLAQNIELVANSENDFPIQKKHHSLEFLRTNIPHLKQKTKTLQYVFKIKSYTFQIIHEFFMKEEFTYIIPPIITNNDCEGAGDLFKIKEKYNKYFKEDTYLSVSGQLYNEVSAQAFSNVYSFGPTFRSDPSHTTRHVAEFWMLEPEIANQNIDYAIELIDKFLKFIVTRILKRFSCELKFFEKKFDTDIIKKLEWLQKNKIKIIDYTTAVKIIKNAIDKGQKFMESKIKWGDDLNTEYEKFLCVNNKNNPLIIINYPKKSKAFYMKENDDKKTVSSFDILFPGIGEIFGGSSRENRKEILLKNIKDNNISFESINWYLKIRNYGYYNSVGFGMGFERLIMYLTGIKNIRDVILAPRTNKKIYF